jgi:OmpA family
MSSTQPIDQLLPSLQRLLAVLEDRPIAGRMVNSTAILLGFAVDSPVLTAEQRSQLDDTIAFLLDRPEASINAIVGRSSQTGPEARNPHLAGDRAEAVKAHLLAGGIAASRIGASVSIGARQPLVNVPGRESELNRSVELWLEWPAVMASPAPATPAATASSSWVFDLVLGADASGPIPVTLAGRFQLGELKRLDANGRVQAKKQVYMLVGGVDVDLLPEQILDLPVSFTIGVGLGGRMAMPMPTGAVDFDWFDGRCVVLVGVAAGLGGSSEGTMLAFPSVDEWPGTYYAQVGTGFHRGGALSGLVGVLKVMD